MTNAFDLRTFILAGGVIHFGILLASALTPQVLDWRRALRPLDPLLRHLIWVHGAFIVLTIVGLGAISIAFAADLAAGAPLARGVSGFAAVFWGTRLAVKFFVFDARPHLKTAFLRLGYHSLTIAFAYLTLVYAFAALGGTT